VAGLKLAGHRLSGAQRHQAGLSRPSGLDGSMWAFCKGASGRSIPEIIQGLISCSFPMDPAETVFGESIS
jgi:hypothetical protein